MSRSRSGGRAETRYRKTTTARHSIYGAAIRSMSVDVQNEPPILTEEEKEKNKQKALEREIRSSSPSWTELYLPWEIEPANERHIKCRQNIVRLERELGFCDRRLALGGKGLRGEFYSKAFTVTEKRNRQIVKYLIGLTPEIVGFTVALVLVLLLTH